MEGEGERGVCNARTERWCKLMGKYRIYWINLCAFFLSNFKLIYMQFFWKAACNFQLASIISTYPLFVAFGYYFIRHMCLLMQTACSSKQ